MDYAVLWIMQCFPQRFHLLLVAEKSATYLFIFSRLKLDPRHPVFFKPLIMYTSAKCCYLHLIKTLLSYMKCLSATLLLESLSLIIAEAFTSEGS